jgi:hypothetical protein
MITAEHGVVLCRTCLRRLGAASRRRPRASSRATGALSRRPLLRCHKTVVARARGGD